MGSGASKRSSSPSLTGDGGDQIRQQLEISRKELEKCHENIRGMNERLLNMVEREELDMLKKKLTDARTCGVEESNGVTFVERSESNHESNKGEEILRQKFLESQEELDKCREKIRGLDARILNMVERDELEKIKKELDTVKNHVSDSDVVVAQGTGASKLPSVREGLREGMSETQKTVFVPEVGEISPATDVSEEEKRVRFNVRRRDIVGMKRTFDDIAKGNSFIGRSDLDTILKAFFHEPSCRFSEEYLNNFMKQMDTNRDDNISFAEFSSAMQEPPDIPDWIISLRLDELMVDAAPKPEGSEVPLPPSSWNQDQIDSVVKAFSDGLGILLNTARANWKHWTPAKDEKKLVVGDLKDFYEGLSGRIGLPHLQFFEAMRLEHCDGISAQLQFETTNKNLNLKTNPELEWNLAVNGQVDTPAGYIVHPTRKLCPLDERVKCTLVRKTSLRKEEVLAVVLYTGPMYRVYSSILRQDNDIHTRFRSAKKLFSTTIHVLVSALIKISQITTLKPGAVLYRGLGLETGFPDSFSGHCDSFAVVVQHHKKIGFFPKDPGFTEFGFMSTSAKKDVALEYSMGKNNSNPHPKVLVIKASSVDRGAYVREISQFPDEEEYLFWPCSYLEKCGPMTLESLGNQCEVAVIHVRASVNLRSKTLDELLVERKGFHLSASKYIVDEIRETLFSPALKSELERRLSTDKTKADNYSVDGFLDRVIEDCQEILNAHETFDAAKFGKSEFLRNCTRQIFEMKMMAVSKVLEWLENTKYSFIHFRFACKLRTAHRRRLSYLEKEHDKLRERARSDSSGQCMENLRTSAIRLCWLLGLVRTQLTNTFDPSKSPQGHPVNDTGADDPNGLNPLQSNGGNDSNESAQGSVSRLCSEYPDIALDRIRNELGENLVMQAAAEGREQVLKLLNEAGVSVSHAREDGVTAMWLAAQFGKRECIRVLYELNASVDVPANDGATPAFIAAQNGHSECIVLLKHLGANVMKENKHAESPIQQAVMNGHDDCVRVLVEANFPGLDKEKQSKLIQDLIDGHHLDPLTCQQNILQCLDSVAPNTQEFARKTLNSIHFGHRKRLIVNSGNISDVDGFLALAEYAKTGDDVLFIMNFPAYVAVESEEVDDALYEIEHPGLGYRFSSSCIFDRDEHEPRDEGYEAFMSNLRSGNIKQSKNSLMKNAMAEAAFQIVSGIWNEAVTGPHKRGTLYFGIGGVNTINPFARKKIRNEVKLYSGILDQTLHLFCSTSDLLAQGLKCGDVYKCDPTSQHQSGRQLFDFRIGDYSQIYMDFCGSYAFWTEGWDQRFRKAAFDGKIKGAFIMGGVATDCPPTTLPSIPGFLNRFSSATMNQLYHPDASGEFFSFLREMKVPTFVVANNDVHDLLPECPRSDDRNAEMESVVDAFLRGNKIDGDYIRQLCLHYYRKIGTKSGLKPFDFHVGIAVSSFLLGSSTQGNRIFAGFPMKYLYYGAANGTTLVSGQATWEGARREYVRTMSNLEEHSCDDGIDPHTISESRRIETEKIRHMVDKASLQVRALRFSLDPATKALSLRPAPSDECTVEDFPSFC